MAIVLSVVHKLTWGVGVDADGKATHWLQSNRRLAPFTDEADAHLYAARIPTLSTTVQTKNGLETFVIQQAEIREELVYGSVDECPVMP